jgi:hypothetical protein
MDRCRSRQQILVLDGCHSGAFAHSSQVRDHVANAFFRAAQMLQYQDAKLVRVGMALAKNRDHRAHVARVD